MKKPLLNNASKFALVCGVAVLFTSIFSPSGKADDASDTMLFSGQVVTNCIIDSTESVNLGSYLPSSTHSASGTDLTVTGTISVTCTLDSSATIKLGPGDNYNAGRRAANNSNYLYYELYQNDNYSTLWGDDTAATGSAASLSITGSGVSDENTVYVKVPKGQSPIGGTYTDTILITVVF